MTPRKAGQFFGETRRLETAGGLIFAENSYLPAQVTPRHTHESMLFYFVVRGVCSEMAAGSESVHAPSTLVFLPAGEAHSTHWSPQDHGCCFHLELTEAYRASRLPGENPLPTSGIISITAGAPSALMHRLYAEFLRWDMFSALVAEGIVLEMMGEFARMHATSSMVTAGLWLSVVEARLREQIETPPTLTELSELVNVHPSHLVRAFRQRHQVTPGEFVRRLRIEEACRRLQRHPDIPLGDLAIELGFADQSHFIRTFRRMTGATPSAYRRIVGIQSI